MVAKLQEKARRIRMVILDVDGVLSDGTINVSGSGELYKAFFVRDGLGIKMLQKAGIPVGIITGRSSDIVARRAEELGITDLAQGQRFKTHAWEAMLARRGLENEEVAYMGDDVPDLPLLMRAGLSATPADGIADLDGLVDFRSHFPGGRGAVRELAELILRAQDRWDDLIRQTYVEGK